MTKFYFILLYFTISSALFSNKREPIVYHFDLPSFYIFFKNEKRLVLLDSGSVGNPLMLNLDILEKYGVKTSKVNRFKDITGKEFSDSVWQIKECSLSNKNFKQVKAVSHVPFGIDIRDGPTSLTQQPIEGIVGLDFFKGQRVILDLKNNYFEIVDTFPEATRDKKWVAFSLLKKQGLNLML